MSDICDLWMAVRTDALGNRFVIADGLDQKSAQEKIATILGRQRKRHGQDYDTHSYRPGERDALVERLGLAL